MVIRASGNNLYAVATADIGALTFSFDLAAKPRHPTVGVSCSARWLLVQHDERVPRSAILTLRHPGGRTQLRSIGLNNGHRAAASVATFLKNQLFCSRSFGIQFCVSRRDLRSKRPFSEPPRTRTENRLIKSWAF